MEERCCNLVFSVSGQLRKMASMRGNIMQRTRCAYFRDEDDLPCNKRRPGSGCSARHGLNRKHAIFGWSDACVATNPSDVAVAFAAWTRTSLYAGSPENDRSHSRISIVCPAAHRNRTPCLIGVT
jgi:xanthine dehydrogenase YagS FAD-binding subunit